VADSRSSRSRIVVDASQQRQRRSPSRRPTPRRNELWIAISIIFAAALATFLALFITSRPYDPAFDTSLTREQDIAQAK